MAARLDDVRAGLIRDSRGYQYSTGTWIMSERSKEPDEDATLNTEQDKQQPNQTVGTSVSLTPPDASASGESLRVATPAPSPQSPSETMETSMSTTILTAGPSGSQAPSDVFASEESHTQDITMSEGSQQTTSGAVITEGSQRSIDDVSSLAEDEQSILIGDDVPDEELDYEEDIDYQPYDQKKDISIEEPDPVKEVGSEDETITLHPAEMDSSDEFTEESLGVEVHSPEQNFLPEASYSAH